MCFFFFENRKIFNISSINQIQFYRGRKVLWYEVDKNIEKKFLSLD